MVFQVELHALAEELKNLCGPIGRSLKVFCGLRAFVSLKRGGYQIIEAQWKLVTVVRDGLDDAVGLPAQGKRVFGSRGDKSEGKHTSDGVGLIGDREYRAFGLVPSGS